MIVKPEFHKARPATGPKRPAVVADWSHCCGLVEKDGRLVPPRARKTFTADKLINDTSDRTEAADWERLREQVKQAAREHPNRSDRLAEFVPMLVSYRRAFERRARQHFGECIFYTATKTRAWTYKNPNQVWRYVPEKGYFHRVLSRLARYVQATSDDEELSWLGFKEWLLTPEVGRKAEHYYPPGTLLARTGKCQVSVAVVGYATLAWQKAGLEADIARECNPLLQSDAAADDQEGELQELEQGSDPASEEDNSVEEMDDPRPPEQQQLLQQAAASDPDEPDADDGDDQEPDEEASDEPPPPPAKAPETVTANPLAPSDDEESLSEPEGATPTINVTRLKRKIQREADRVKAEERNLAVRKSNIALWEDQLKDHFAAAETRKRAREEEIEGMQRQVLVDRCGCTVDISKEHRKVVAAYIKDVGEYADPDGVLTEHFTSAKRQQRAFTHQRGAQMLRGPGYGLGASRFQASQVRHDYLGHSNAHHVVVVLEAKDECSYFNVGVSQMQLTRAEVSLQEFPDFTKFYHAAYATAPPCGDIHKHNALGQLVYSLDMSAEAKERFFAPLRQALAAA
jgi:hypothetical protein